MNFSNTVSLEAHTIEDIMQQNAVLEYNPKVILRDKYDIKEDQIVPDFGEVVIRRISVKDNSESLLCRFKDAVVFIERYKTTVEIFVFAQNQEQAKAVVEDIRAQVSAEEIEANEIKVKFWMLGPTGPTSITRTIVVPTWDEITHNYHAQTRAGLSGLFRGFNPEGRGKLILWHGKPGTGKTYALRALVKEWEKWATINYILDPEVLFGGNPSYLTKMVFDRSYAYDTDDDFLPVGEDKYKVFILEDTGELLAEDARERTGQGLSRLLNVADGFIGQGLKVLFLITTNEQISKLHPAVSRDGRCAAAINFDLLTLEEARAWAEKNSVILNTPVSERYLLSNLYGMKSEAKIEVEISEANKLGFRMR